MLSICIPVYNNDIVSLVHTLARQCKGCNIPFEIICIDDASSLYKEKNRTLSGEPELRYSELTENVGRAVIRNLLAQTASYDYLLYVDSDVSIRNNDFIQTYIKGIHRSDPVVVGGILYHEMQVGASTKLHYTYGTKRESRSAAERNKKPYSSFLTGNLLVQKKLVEEIQFLSSLKEYGHEDTLFCLELKKRSIPVLHLDNALIHEGLEKNEVFVEKQLTAVRNLSSLIQQGYDMRGISLYDAYARLNHYKLSGIFTFCFGAIRRIVYSSLVTGKSNWLLLFDALRLYELSVMLRKK